MSVVCFKIQGCDEEERERKRERERERETHFVVVSTDRRETMQIYGSSLSQFSIKKKKKGTEAYLTDALLHDTPQKVFALLGKRDTLSLR